MIDTPIGHDNGDFIWGGMLGPANCTGTPDGLTYASAIERDLHPSKWAEAIPTIPEAVRPRAVEYLRQRYRLWQEAMKARKEREERLARGKKSEAGDKALAELAKRYGAKP